MEEGVVVVVATWDGDGEWMKCRLKGRRRRMEAAACEMKKMGSFGPESGLGRWLELDDVNERGVPFSPAGICGGWRSSFS